MPVWDTHPAYDKQKKKWIRARDAVAGSDAVKDAGESYLPMLKDQDEDEYRSYKKRATWFGASNLVVSGLKGMLFRKQPKVIVPDSVIPLLEDVDMAGRPLSAFAEEFVEEILTVGRVGILVDHPPSIDLDGVPITLAVAQQLNLRPTMQLYTTEQIINWKQRRVNNVWALSMVVLQEVYTEAKDEWSNNTENRWRVLDLDDNNEYRQRIFRKTTDKDRIQGVKEDQIQVGEDVYPLVNGKKLNFIPFYCADEDDVDICPDPPPLIDLFDINLAHYRVSADYEHGCHFTGLPTPVISGYVPEQTEDGTPPPKLYVGSSHAWVFPDPGAKATYLEFHGTGLAALEKNLERKEMQMAIIGSRMLVPDNTGRTPTGATTTVVHRLGETSRLADIANAASTAFRRALTLFAEWAGAPSSNVEYQISRDFLPVIVDANSLTAMVAAVGAQTLPFNDFWDMLQRGDLAPMDKTAEQALADIKSQPDFLKAATKEPAPKPAGGSPEQKSQQASPKDATQ